MVRVREGGKSDLRGMRVVGIEVEVEVKVDILTRFRGAPFLV